MPAAALQGKDTEQEAIVNEKRFICLLLGARFDQGGQPHARSFLVAIRKNQKRAKKLRNENGYYLGAPSVAVVRWHGAILAPTSTPCIAVGELSLKRIRDDKIVFHREDARDFTSA